MTTDKPELASLTGDLVRIRHQLRTPLAAIIGYSELLLEDARERGHEAFLPRLGEIHRAARLALNHVKELVNPAVFAAGAGWEDLCGRVREPLAAVLERSAELHAVARRRAPELTDDLENVHAACRYLRRHVRGLAGEVDAGKPEDSLPPAPASRSAAALAPSEARGSVLVVDDHPANRELTARVLEKVGYRVVVAESGPLAFEELATDGGFDLVLLDVLMPGMDGYEVLRELKRHERFGRIPVILISALDEMKNVVEGLRLGAEDYLPRPFDAEVLKSRVAAAIEKKRLGDEIDAEGDEPGELGRSFRRMTAEIHRREDRLRRLRPAAPGELSK